MIKKTKDYDQFVFRNDNREKVDQAHAKRLAESIKARNLLELRPIVVNEKMEVIDGQHRLIAAKMIGVEIYYQQEKKLDAEDIIRMNVAKSWTTADYLNFYCHHEYEEYKKIAAFMKKHKLSLKVALTIALGQSNLGFTQFREGKFVFNTETLDIELDICWETIHYIRKMNGYSSYTNSSRFWKALLMLVRHVNFDPDKWRSNLHRMVEHFTCKARYEDYLSVMQHIYNYRNNLRINLSEKEL